MRDGFDGVLDEQLERIEKRQTAVGVIGLGYVGLPLAVAFAEAGFRVVGFDIDARRVRMLNEGTSPIQDVSAAVLRTHISSGAFRATDQFDELERIDAVSICVPTPVLANKAPDLSYVFAAAQQVRNYLHPAQLVTIESTTYPGMTCEEIVPLLEHCGLAAGRDFYVAFSPERIDPGNPKYGLKNTPKVVGGLTPRCASYASALYSTVADEVVVVSSPTSAELVKLLENTFRAVNIGLAAEFAQISDRLGVDVWEMINAAATKPFGFMPFYPGPGVGGHCIPVDPHYLLWRMEELNFPTPLIQTGMRVIEAMPHFVVDQIAAALAERGKTLEEARVLLLGVTYKRDVEDVRESPALEVIALLQDRFADIGYVDAYVPELRVGEQTLHAEALTPEALREADCTVILTDHSHVDYALVVREAPLVLDTRNATKEYPQAEHVWRLVGPARSRVVPRRSTHASSLRGATTCVGREAASDRSAAE